MLEYLGDKILECLNNVEGLQLMQGKHLEEVASGPKTELEGQHP